MSSPQLMNIGNPNVMSSPDSANQATSTKFERANEQRNEDNYKSQSLAKQSSFHILKTTLPSIKGHNPFIAQNLILSPKLKYEAD